MDDNTDDEFDDAALRKLLGEFRVEHRYMDAEITALRETGATDMINIARMKKLKLRLKDKIAKLEDMLTPDIIA